MIKQILLRLAQARTQAGLSQSQAAKQVNIGTGAFLDIENGKIPLSVEMMINLCTIYDINEMWVLTGRNPYFDERRCKEMVDNSNISDSDKLSLISLMRSLKRRGI